MRILIVSNLYPPAVLGGYEILCAQVCDALRDRGHDVTVLTSDHGVATGATNGALAPKADEHVHRTLRLLMPFDRAPRVRAWEAHRIESWNTRETERLLAESRPALVFIWSQLRLSLGSAAAAERAGLPTAYTVNDRNLEGYVPPRRSFTPRGLARTLRHGLRAALWPRVTTADLRWRNVACISASLKRTLIEMGVPLESSKVIYQGIPLASFPLKPDPGSLHDPVRFLYVGALLPYKGVHTILEAFGQLAGRKPRGHSMALTVVGDGPEGYVQKLRELAAAADAEVTFTGRVPHDALSQVYRDHDVFIFASEALEGFGLTHLEAMASGTTVISSDRGGHVECMQDGVNTLLFGEGRADELADRMARLMEDPALCESLARAARAMVEKDFSLDGYVSHIEAFLRDALRADTRPPG